MNKAVQNALNRIAEKVLSREDKSFKETFKNSDNMPKFMEKWNPGPSGKDDL